MDLHRMGVMGGLGFRTWTNVSRVIDEYQGLSANLRLGRFSESISDFSA